MIQLKHQSVCALGDFPVLDSKIFTRVMNNGGPYFHRPQLQLKKESFSVLLIEALAIIAAMAPEQAREIVQSSLRNEETLKSPCMVHNGVCGYIVRSKNGKLFFYFATGCIDAKAFSSVKFERVNPKQEEVAKDLGGQVFRFAVKKKEISQYLTEESAKLFELLVAQEKFKLPTPNEDYQSLRKQALQMSVTRKDSALSRIHGTLEDNKPIWSCFDVRPSHLGLITAFTDDSPCEPQPPLMSSISGLLKEFDFAHSS
jgi:hypothetical protein